MKLKYSQRELITMISEKTGYHDYNILEIFVAMEEIIIELLLLADENKDIEIRLMPGIGLFSYFVPSHDKRMPDGSIKRTKDSIRFVAKVTDSFTRTRRRTYEYTRELWERVKRRNRK